MKVTVCELRNEPAALAEDWGALVDHVMRAESDFVLLPEMPFHPWLAGADRMDPDAWAASCEAHEDWITRFSALAPAVVAATRPVVLGEQRLNEGFLWEASTGPVPVHLKRYLPDEPDFFEASWYDRGPPEFRVHDFGRGRAGFLICTEMWFGEHARDYARQGIQLLLCPRATHEASGSKWIAGGRAAAVFAGAYGLSSNFRAEAEGGVPWGGTGWIVDPDGELLGVTDRKHPFLTVEIDLRAADNAKHTYPRYVIE